MKIAAGGAHACAVLPSGTLECWGDNDYGQLGLGDLPGGARLVVAASAHTCVLTSQGAVKCWGDNSVGQLGLGDREGRGDDLLEWIEPPPSVQLGSGLEPVALAATARHTCALFARGEVKCWGANESGQLGLGDAEPRGIYPGQMGDELPAIDLGSDRVAVAIAAGGNHSCAVLAGGEVKCWGANESGQLGLGDRESRGDGPEEMGDALGTVPLYAQGRALSISAGARHSCVLREDGQAECWGANGAMQLGLNHREPRGDRSPWPDSEPPIDLGSERSVLAVAAGASHTCALRDDQRVRCWGFNVAGTLGIGRELGYYYGAVGADIPPVDLGAAGGVAVEASALAAGVDFSCALLPMDQVKCWGANQSGQLGVGDLENRGSDLAQMGNALPAVKLK
jgi:alpha-tubulin suppressor-like RCC1 family protein